MTLEESTISLIEKRLKENFAQADITVQDDAQEHVGHAHEGSGHFTVFITSPVFEGKTPIQRHRLVYDALGELMQSRIHALKIKANTPA